MIWQWQKSIVALCGFLWLLLGLGSFFIDHAKSAGLVAIGIALVIWIYGLIIIKEYE